MCWGMRTSDRIEQQGLDEKEEEADIADGLLVMRRHAIGLKHQWKTSSERSWCTEIDEYHPPRSRAATAWEKLDL